jgi:hypothetical protein
LRALFRMPEGTLQRVRWTLLLLCTPTALTALPSLLSQPTPVATRIASTSAYAFVLWHWTRVYRKGGSPPWQDVLEGLAPLVVGMSASDPASSWATAIFYGGLGIKCAHATRAGALRIGLIYLGVLMTSGIATDGTDALLSSEAPASP